MFKITNIIKNRAKKRLFHLISFLIKVEKTEQNSTTPPPPPLIFIKITAEKIKQLCIYATIIK